MKRGANAEIMTPAEVAAFFGVTVKTVWRWSVDGLLPHFFTPGLRRRYRRADIEAVRDRKKEQAAP